MSVFNIDENMILNVVGNALEEAGSDMSEDQFTKVAERIEESMPGVIELLTYGMQDHWKSEARNSPTGWGEKYANSINAKVTGNRGVVYIDEEMKDKKSNKPNSMFVSMVEEGMKPFSIKDALMKSSKAKTSSAGIKYIIVPFPVATPRKKNQGKQASKFGGREMTREAHEIVKNGGKFTGKLKSGQKASGLTQYVTRQRHEQYGMFICVTQNSKGWIHPGVMASPVFPSVLSEVNKRVGEIVGEFCKAIVKEYS